MARYVGGIHGYETALERRKTSEAPWTPDPSLGHLLYAMRKVGPKIPADDPDVVRSPRLQRFILVLRHSKSRP